MRNNVTHTNLQLDYEVSIIFSFIDRWNHCWCLFPSVGYFKLYVWLGSSNELDNWYWVRTILILLSTTKIIGFISSNDENDAIQPRNITNEQFLKMIHDLERDISDNRFVDFVVKFSKLDMNLFKASTNLIHGSHSVLQCTYLLWCVWKCGYWDCISN